MSQLIQMFRQHGARVHIAQLNGTDCQIFFLFADDNHRCGGGNLFNQMREAWQKGVNQSIHMTAEECVQIIFFQI